MTIQENADLRHYNTFGIEASARYFTPIRNTDDLQSLLASSQFQKGPHLILGGGSNVLFTGNFAGLVARIELKGISIVDETEDHVTLSVGAGENWHGLV